MGIGNAMEKYALDRFLYEILTQCQFVQLSAATLNIAMSELAQPKPAETFAERCQRSAEMAAAEEREPGLGFRKGLENSLGAIKPTNRVWFALQGILVAAANISKLLWGTADPTKRAAVEAARKPLRDSIGISSDSPLRSRSLRNGFEHFDGELEARTSAGPSPYSSRNIMQALTADEQSGHFGHYDPVTGQAYFWSRSASIPDIVAEVDRIMPLVLAAMADGLLGNI